MQKSEDRLTLEVATRNLKIAVKELQEELDSLDPFASHQAALKAASIQGIVSFMQKELEK